MRSAKTAQLLGETPQPLAYTTATAALAVGMSDQFLRKEIKAGRLGCRYAGRSLLIPADELKAWLDALPSERPEGPRGPQVAVDLG